MVQVIKQPTHTTEVITKDGEVKILLEITINVNSNTSSVQVGVNQSEKKCEEDDVRWVIPSFKSENKIKFGKKIEE